MNYNYTEAFLEIEFPSGSKRRFKKSTIEQISQVKSSFDDNEIDVCIYTSRDCYTLRNCTLEDFDKMAKTIYI